jgi:acyl-CoA thioesterase-1
MKRVACVTLALSLHAVCLLGAGCSRSPRDAANEVSDPVAQSARSSAVEVSSGSRPFDSHELAQGRPRVVFLGNSLTAGYGLPKEQSVPSLIQKRLDAEGYNVEVVNQGVSGDTSAGGVSRLDWSLSGDVRVLVLELGGNDGLRGLPIETTKQNLAQIITTAKQRGVRVLLTGMEAPPSHGPAYTSQFRQLFRDLADEHDVAFMPFFLEGVAGDSALNQADGIHPTAEGAAIVERTLWKSLKPILEGVRHAEAAQQRRRTDTTKTQ